MQQPHRQRLNGFKDVLTYKKPLSKKHWPYRSLASKYLYENNEIEPLQFNADECPTCGGRGHYWQEKKVNRSKLVKCDCKE